MKNVHSLLTPLLCLMAMQWPVTAHAEFGISGQASADARANFHKTCDITLHTQKTGDMALGDCTKAQMAERVHKLENANKVIFGAATVVASAMIAVEATGWGQPIAKPVCIGLAIGGVGKTFLDQSTIKASGQEALGTYASTVNSAVKMGVMAYGGNALKGMVFDGKSLKDAFSIGKKTAEAADKTKNSHSCIPVAIGLGVLTASAFLGADASRQMMESSTKAADVKLTASSQTVTYNLKQNPADSKPTTNPGNSGGTPKTDAGCDNESGTAFAKCLGKTSPEIAALVSNPQAFETMNRALGQNLGDFAKNFKGDSQQDLANYIGGATGLGSSAVSGILDASKKTAQALGLQEAYKPGAYASAGGGSAGKHGGPDPMEQMLADMMKKMGDPGEDGLGKERDPASEISFNNQMELMTPEQIESRKDISLFDRAHYRMQKNAKNLEQLNWSVRDQ